MVVDYRGHNQLVVSTAFMVHSDMPRIMLACGSQEFAVELTPEQAQALAGELVQAAEAAVAESFMVNYLQNYLGLEPKDVAAALEQGRMYKERVYGFR